MRFSVPRYEWALVSLERGSMQLIVAPELGARLVSCKSRDATSCARLRNRV